ncbi:MAG: glycosyltransferase family 2 protein, partial [Acidimicrobiales bacterium]
LNMVTAMVAVAESHERIGSVTAWSNNASAFSLPNHDDTGLLQRQDMVDWISAEMTRMFTTSAIDLPTGVGFCMLMAVPVVRQVGLFDPAYGRGYCEEVDWSLRSRRAGYRAVLAPSTFVFHLGNGSTAGTGMLAHQQTTVAEHEQIVDLRYPAYRGEVDAFLRTGVMDELAAQAVRTLVVLAAQRWGYHVEAAWLPSAGIDASRMRVIVDPDGDRPSAHAEFCGFRHPLVVGDGGMVEAVMDLVGSPPAAITVADRGRHADQLLARWGDSVPVDDRYGYPQRI